jgi:hypothetical protein
VLGWDEDARSIASAAWNSVFSIWITLLIQMRSRQYPRREWFWTLPVAFFLLAATWIVPQVWGLCLIAIHPLVALWILDRELRRSRPEFRHAYHWCLGCLPVLVGILWWRLASESTRPGEDVLTQQIIRQAGADVLGGVSCYALVAIHSFLQTIHYGVWLAAIPLVGLRTAPWRLDSIPLARRTPRWRIAVSLLLAVGLIVVLVLWAGFLTDYAATWNVYFSISLLHVLAEFPFLLRAL